MFEQLGMIETCSLLLDTAAYVFKYDSFRVIVPCPLKGLLYIKCQPLPKEKLFPKLFNILHEDYILPGRVATASLNCKNPQSLAKTSFRYSLILFFVSVN